MEERELKALVDVGLSTREIADRAGRHPRIVAGWLREYGLRTTEPVRRRHGARVPGSRRIGRCLRHGETEFVARSDAGWRCVLCRSEQVSAARRRRKALLVAEAGGRCALCGYDRCVGALQFHHLDADTKRFGIAFRGAARSLASMRAEAAKCVLLCANCHVEVEAGTAVMPIQWAQRSF